jgi:antitoxin (DNA-binding transcriptional repressor) of toxin-antitoxin stability system
MSTVTLEEAQKRLSELVKTLPEAGEIIIIDGEKAVAKLAAMAATETHSILDFKPRSVGKIMRPLCDRDDDLLGEMLDNKFDRNK